MIEITHTPIIPEAITNQVNRDKCGCVVSFTGIVRNTSASGKKVISFENDASAEELARQELQRIEDEVRTKWQLQDTAMCHRMGKLEVGEYTFVVAISAPHRIEAFEACQYIIDRFKQVVKAWEKEITE